MCECRASVVLQGAQYRIGVDLIARTIQITGTIVTADVVAERDESVIAIIDDDVSAGTDLEVVFLIYGGPSLISTLLCSSCYYQHLIHCWLPNCCKYRLLCSRDGILVTTVAASIELCMPPRISANGAVTQ